MPLAPADENVPLGPIAQPAPEPDKPEVSLSQGELSFLGDVLPAALQLDNTVVSTLSNEAPTLGPFTRIDQDFDPFENIEGYEDFAEDFALTNNLEQVSMLKGQIDKERENRAILDAASGLQSFGATALAVLTDPVQVLMPGGTLVNSVGKSGYSMLSTARSVAMSTLVAEGSAELLLQSSQATRTAGETIGNVAAGTVLGGVLGSSVARINNKQLKALEEQVEKDMVIPDLDKPDKPQQFIDDSLSAARKIETTAEQETLVSAFGLEKATRALAPNLRLPQSPSLATRRVAQDLLDIPLYFNKYNDGVAASVPVETLTKEYRNNIATSRETLLSEYRAFKKASKKEGLENLSFTQFKERVAIANRNNDIDPANKFVTKVAQKYRNTVLNPLRDRAIAADLLPKDVSVTTAPSYLHRVWDSRKIVAREVEFRDTVSKWVRSEVRNEIKKFDARMLRDRRAIIRAINDLEKAPKPDQKKIAAERQKLAELDIESRQTREGFFDTDNNFDAYVDDVTNEITNTLVGRSGELFDYSATITARGPLKERVFNIPDRLVDGSTGGSNFISNDIEYIAERYVRTLGTDVELKDKFGSVTMEDQIKAINDDYTELAKAVDEREAQRLNKMRKRDVEDLEVMRDIMRGTPDAYTSNPDNTWVRAARLARTWNYVKSLGGVTVSSFPDAARPVMVHGLTRTVGDALIPMIRSFKGFKMSVAEAKLAGQVHETILNDRIRTLAEITDPYASGTAFERFSDNTANFFSKATGLTYWNQFWKATSSVITQARIIDNVGKYDNLSKGEQRYLAFLGIDKVVADGIARQLRRHGRTVDGVKIANTEAWENEALRRVYRAAINKDVDRTIVTKSVGDVPLVFNGATGQTMGQFKSFVLAANQRVMLAGLQERSAAQLTGLIFAITAGMATFAFKTLERGEELPDDPGKWIVEGLDRSGVIPVLMEANNMAEKLGAPGLSRLTGSGPVSRYASRNFGGTIAGPTFGTINDLGVLGRATFTGEVSESDVRTIRRLIPFQNLVLVRQLFDTLEEGLNNTIGTTR